MGDAPAKTVILAKLPEALVRHTCAFVDVAWLARLARVNRALQRLVHAHVQSAQFLTVLTPSGRTDDVVDSAAISLLSHARSLVRLNIPFGMLSRKPNPYPAVLGRLAQIIAANSATLRSHTSLCPYSLMSLYALGSCARLEALTIPYDHLDLHHFQLLTRIVRECKAIRRVRFEMQNPLDDGGRGYAWKMMRDALESCTLTELALAMGARETQWLLGEFVQTPTAHPLAPSAHPVTPTAHPLARHAHTLTSLKLTGLGGTQPPFPLAFLDVVAGLTSLTSLEIAGFGAIPPMLEWRLPASLTHLIAPSVGSLLLIGLTSIAAAIMTVRELHATLRVCPSLTSLAVSRIDHAVASLAPAVASLFAGGKSCPCTRLTHLVLGPGYELCAADLLAVAESCSGMRHIDVQIAQDVEEHHVLALIALLPRLTKCTLDRFPVERKVRKEWRGRPVTVGAEAGVAASATMVRSAIETMWIPTCSASFAERLCAPELAQLTVYNDPHIDLDIGALLTRYPTLRDLFVSAPGIVCSRTPDMECVSATGRALGTRRAGLLTRLWLDSGSIALCDLGSHPAFQGVRHLTFVRRSLPLGYEFDVCWIAHLAAHRSCFPQLRFLEHSQFGSSQFFDHLVVTLYAARPLLQWPNPAPAASCPTVLDEALRAICSSR